jgi:hypothetical protein
VGKVPGSEGEGETLARGERSAESAGVYAQVKKFYVVVPGKLLECARSTKMDNVGRSIRKFLLPVSGKIHLQCLTP